MTEAEVLTALGHLVGSTNGWEAPETIDEYARQLVDLDDEVALRQACVAIARGWSELARPPIALILEGYDRESSFRSKQIAPTRRHCDGSGNVPYTGDPTTFVPCPRCLPAKAAVYADPDKRRQYDEGTGIEFLDVGVERVGGRLRYRDGFRPPRCHAAEDAPDEMPKPVVGLEIAWRAWADEQKALGRKPTRRKFDDLAMTDRLRAALAIDKLEG